MRKPFRKIFYTLTLTLALVGLTFPPQTQKVGAAPGTFTGKLAVIHRMQAANKAQIELYTPGIYGRPDTVIDVGANYFDDRLYSPAWSPDGTKLAFMLNDEAYTVEADGTNLRQISHVFDPPQCLGLWFCTPPRAGITWSPDGTRLAFTSQNRLFIADADGSNVVKIGDGVEKPSWSVKDEIAVEVLYWYDGYFRASVRIVRPDGSNAGWLITPDYWLSGGKGLPALSPDGNTLAVVSTDRMSPYQRSQIFLVNRDGTNLRQLTQEHNSEDRRNPTWTPDGKAITFESIFIPYSDTIYTKDVMTGVETAILAGSVGAGFTDPAWQPRATPLGPVDTVLPTVSLTRPTNNARVRNTTTFRATARDNVRVVMVEFYVNNKFVGSDSEAPYSIAWNSFDLPNGQYTVQAKAIDQQGNVGLSKTKTIRVSNR